MKTTAPVKFNNDVLCEPYSMIVCPHCGNDYMHQGRVRIYERDSEDSVTGLYVDTARMLFIDKHDMAQNPSRRRQGIRVDFECECCSYFSGDNKDQPSTIFELCIIQNKGNTYLFWEYDDINIPAGLACENGGKQ